MPVRPWGTVDGGACVLCTLDDGVCSVDITNYGAIVTAVRVPDRQGRLGNVVLGHDRLAPYLLDDAYLGAVVGRSANRIARGRCELAGKPLQLTQNDGRHHLHGGARGFSRRVWGWVRGGRREMVLALTSVDGDEGYPGRLQVEVRYALPSAGTLEVSYSAQADRATLVNLTQHSYFNLAGAGTIDGHALQVSADHYLPTDAALIPTGERRPVDGPYDLRDPATVGALLARSGQAGVDHSYLLGAPGVLRHAARLTEPTSGRGLDVWTTQPALHVYTGHALHPPAFSARAGLCLEAQHPPDAPNHPSFDSTVLRPGEAYRHVTQFRFFVTGT
ncbi:MAG: galactose mutarotase [Deltaproteobacteria bacterium]|nr:galactose mutarotase [Deltaproteobacteria bacterium]